MAHQTLELQQLLHANDEPAVEPVSAAGAPQAAGEANGHVNSQATSAVAAAGGAVTAAGGAGAGNAAVPPAEGQEDPVAAQQAAEDAEYLDKMRGWLMTVATLFVTMAFQAAMRPPAWMPSDLLEYIANYPAYSLSLSKSKSTDSALTTGNKVIGVIFLVFIWFTFVIALSMVVMLVMTKKGQATPDIKMIRMMVPALACGVVSTFACSISGDPEAFGLTLFGSFLMGVAISIVRTYFLRTARDR